MILLDTMYNLIENESEDIDGLIKRLHIVEYHSIGIGIIRSLAYFPITCVILRLIQKLDMEYYHQVYLKILSLCILLSVCSASNSIIIFIEVSRYTYREHHQQLYKILYKLQFRVDINNMILIVLFISIISLAY